MNVARVYCVFDRSLADFFRGSEHGRINRSSESIYRAKSKCTLRPELSRHGEYPSPAVHQSRSVFAACHSIAKAAIPLHPEEGSFSKNLNLKNHYPFQEFLGRCCFETNGCIFRRLRCNRR